VGVIREKVLKRLIDDKFNLVNALPEVLPAVKQDWLKLCDAEVSEIDTECLPVLFDIVRSRDKGLEAAISAAMRSDVGE
jgi:hypothetical protein